jgi:hypothetical protein
MANGKAKRVVVGIGETAVGKLPQMTSLAIQLQAIQRAIKDAGLQPVDVVGMPASQPGDDRRQTD